MKPINLPQVDDHANFSAIDPIDARYYDPEIAKYLSERGLKVIIAGAGGSAHLPGMTASETSLPVIAIPVRKSEGHEAFWSNIKMPPGIPLATMSENGAKNGALLAVRILALQDDDLSKKYADFIQNLHDSVLAKNAQIDQQGWESLLAK